MSVFSWNCWLNCFTLCCQANPEQPVQYILRVPCPVFFLGLLACLSPCVLFAFLTVCIKTTNFICACVCVWLQTMSLREKSDEEIGDLLNKYGIKHGPIVGNIYLSIYLSIYLFMRGGGATELYNKTKVHTALALSCELRKQCYYKCFCLLVVNATSIQNLCSSVQNSLLFCTF